MPPDVCCHYCGDAAGTSCARCDAALCLRHAHDRLHRCRDCEREFRRRPSRRIVTAAVGSVIIGTSTVIGGFVGLVLACALSLWAGAAGPAVFMVFLLFTALGVGAGSVAALHFSDTSIRPQFLLERERRAPRLPPARVVV